MGRGGTQQTPTAPPRLSRGLAARLEGLYRSGGFRGAVGLDYEERYECERDGFDEACLGPCRHRRIEGARVAAIERHSKTQERIGLYRSLPNPSGRERRALVDLPQAIAVKRGKRLRLLDGRHRLEAAKRAGLDELSVLVGRRG